jgi:anti-anti-sigma factor
MKTAYTSACMLMEISHHEIAPGAVEVKLAGKLMLGSESEQIVTLVDELLRRGVRTIIFNLAAVTAIDSTGVGRFIWSYNKIAAAGGDMRMAAAAGHVLQTFRVSLLDTVFSFYSSLEEARQVGN